MTILVLLTVAGRPGVHGDHAPGNADLEARGLGIALVTIHYPRTTVLLVSAPVIRPNLVRSPVRFAEDNTVRCNFVGVLFIPDSV